MKSLFEKKEQAEGTHRMKEAQEGGMFPLKTDTQVPSQGSDSYKQTRSNICFLKNQGTW